MFWEALSFVCVAALVLVGWREKRPRRLSNGPRPRYRCLAISLDVPYYLDEVGRCVAREVVSVQPEVSGRITEIHFTDGGGFEEG